MESFVTTFAGGDIGDEMHALIRELYPLCRSITGNGLRDTLKLLRRHIPLQMREVPTGTPVFDWTVPKEWNITDAYIADVHGRRVVDFARSNLHVMGYSVPVRRRVRLAELREHLFTLPDSPDCIPWRTSLYKETWGFCLPHRQLAALRDEEYDVCIDASLEDGYLTLGEYYLPGQIEAEVLITSHTCHPSLANDNLSGIALAALLARSLTPLARRYSYRFLFVPVTIGAITWLALNEDVVPRIKHALALACVGDPGPSTYKKSRRGNADIDRALSHVLRHSGAKYEIQEFSPYGYDERQFCSPAFDVPMGSLMRTPHGRYPEYHTSADDLDFVQPAALADSFAKAWSALYIVEHNRVYENLNPKCEPQLGRRGLYRSVGGPAGDDAEQLALLWVLNLSDGRHDLLEIAERSSLAFSLIKAAADRLVGHGLLDERDGAPVPNTSAR